MGLAQKESPRSSQLQGLRKPWATEDKSVLTNRVPTPACAVKQNRYEYQDAICSLPLTGAELRVLLYLLKCGARTGEAWPKHQTIARVCRCHQDTARRATHRLEELGLIRIVRGRTFNRYRFPWHAGFVRPDAPAMSDLPPYQWIQNGDTFYIGNQQHTVTGGSAMMVTNGAATTYPYRANAMSAIQVKCASGFIWSLHGSRSHAARRCQLPVLW